VFVAKVFRLSRLYICQFITKTENCLECDRLWHQIYQIHQMPPRQLPTVARQGLRA